jgi:hypothetical protein
MKCKKQIFAVSINKILNFIIGVTDISAHGAKVGIELSSRFQVPSPKSEVRSPKSQVPSPKSEVRSPKSQVPSPKSQVPSPKSNVYK